MGADREGVIVPARRLFLPFRTPARRSRGHRAHLNRAAAADGRIEITAAEETKAGVVEIVALEIVDRRGIDASADEGIDFVIDEKLHRRHHLQTEILADDAAAVAWIIGLPDS